MIIALSGPKGCGKDTVAKLFCAAGFVHHKISTKLKRVVCELLDYTEEELEQKKDDYDSSWKIFPREMLQFMGTEVMQYSINEIMPDLGRCFWIRSFIQDLGNNPKFVGKNIVVSDLRFRHELDMLDQEFDRKVIVVQIQRKSIQEDDLSEHISEQEYKKIPYDYLLDNYGTTRDLEQQFTWLLSEIKEHDFEYVNRVYLD